jgi:uncharacterized caspase-like protein
MALIFLLHFFSSLITQAQTSTSPRQVEQLEPVNILPNQDKRWALIIGIDDYQDEEISKLKGASNDAKALAKAIEMYAGFRSDHITVLASSQQALGLPTRRNILSRLSNMRKYLPKDGLLLIAFSGHGIERDGHAYLLPADAVASEDVVLLEETAINMERVKQSVYQTGIKQVIFIIDACRSDPFGGRAIGNNPMTENFKKSLNFDVRNQKIKAFATFYATEVGQRAYEYEEKKQGYFTWAIVEGLSGGAANKNGEITLAGLANYLEDVVPRLVQYTKGQEQRPYHIIGGFKADELVLAAVERPSLNLTDETVEEPARMVGRGKEATTQANPQMFFYIIGKVKQPGEKVFHSGITLTQGVLLAGGLSRSEGKLIYIIRRGEDGRLITVSYNFKDIKRGHKPDPQLRAGDTIEVLR